VSCWRGYLSEKWISSGKSGAIVGAGGSSAALLGLAEMKTGSKRGPAGHGAGSGVLDAPGEDYAREMDWTRPAPAGALHRTYADDFSDNEDYGGRRRSPAGKSAPFRLRFRGLPRGLWGRVLFGGVTVVVLGSVTATVLRVRQYLLHNPRFVVAGSSNIQISGNKHLTREQVLSVFGADLARDIFKVPLAQRRADLERLPWVGHATVMRLLPDQIRIAITERTPVAFVKEGDTIGLVDANGVLLDMPVEAEGDAHYSFPVLTGLSAGDPMSKRKAQMDIYGAFVQDLNAQSAKTGPRPTDSLSEVDVTDPEDVKAVVTGNGADVLVHFGDEDFLTRYKEFEDHLPEWRQQYPKLVSADMRYANQIVLDTGAELPGGAQTASSGGDAAGVAPDGAAAAPVAATPVAAPVVAAPIAVKPVEVTAARPAPVKPKTTAAQKLIAKETNESNQRMYAALAAAHKAEIAKEAAAQQSAGEGAVRP
jgi:cell division protein FtsQ